MRQGGRGGPLQVRPVIDLDLGWAHRYGYRDLSRDMTVCGGTGYAPSNLRSVRRSAGASQVQVAALLGVCHTAVSKWETYRCRPPKDVQSRWPAICAEAAGGVR